MLYVVEITNPLELRKLQYRTAPDGMTVRQLLLLLKGPEFIDFDYPTVCVVNSQYWLREEWNEQLPPGARVAFIRLAGTWEWIIVYLVIAIISIVLALVLTPDTPNINNDQQNGDPVYTLSGQRNQVKLNDPIESAYGRCRLWPAYAARPYNVYDGNQQYQFSLYCLGHGHFDIEDMLFEDTPIENFDEVDYQIVPPGGEVSLFADNVDTSSAVANIELFGPNEEEFRGWSGGFFANEPRTKTNRLEVDISLPAGLYNTDEAGGELLFQAVEVAFQYREINDIGQAVGDWIPLTFSKKRVMKLRGGVQSNRYYVAPVYEIITVPTFYRNLRTVTPQRFTLGADVPLGRYEVRAQRLNNKNKARGASNVVKWEALRVFFPSVRQYGQVTLIAIKARATNNLNNNAAQKFNVIAERRLSKWDEQAGSWTEPVSTRNPVWAFCDVFRAPYGGRLPAEFLDVEELNELAELFDAERIYFDYIFDQRTTVWEAAKAIAKVARGIPMLSGSLITIVRDQARTAALAVFNQHNIVSGSFTWNIKLRDVEDTDGIEVLYIDEETWKEESILCLIGEDEGAQPRQLRLPGCTDRMRAYREGLYARATELYLRENIEFRTGLEGHLPRYGDLILVSHDVPRWGVGGLVHSIEGDLITVDRELTFTEGLEHRVTLRKKDGSAYGPFPVASTASAYVVRALQTITEDFYFDQIHEPPYFILTTVDEAVKECIVVGIDPQEDDTVKVKCQGYEQRVFSYDTQVPPPRGIASSGITDPARPFVSAIRVTALINNADFVIISWPPALGARNYLLEQSEDGENWSRAVTLPSTAYELHVVPGNLWVRVAGVNVDIGQWIVWRGRVGDVATLPDTPLDLSLLLRGNGFVTVGWSSLLNADNYDVSIFEHPSGRFLRKVNTSLLTFTYTWTDAMVDGLAGYDIRFRVRGVNILGTSEEPAVLDTYIGEAVVVAGSVSIDSTQVLLDTTKITIDKT